MQNVWKPFKCFSLHICYRRTLLFENSDKYYKCWIMILWLWFYEFSDPWYFGLDLTCRTQDSFHPWTFLCIKLWHTQINPHSHNFWDPATPFKTPLCDPRTFSLTNPSGISKTMSYPPVTEFKHSGISRLWDRRGSMQKFSFWEIYNYSPLFSHLGDIFTPVQG